MKTTKATAFVKSITPIRINPDVSLSFKAPVSGLIKAISNNKVNTTTTCTIILLLVRNPLVQAKNTKPRIGAIKAVVAWVVV
jgi:hypothetical protein